MAAPALIERLGAPFPPIVERKACRYGDMLFPAFDHYVGRALHEYGEYSEGEVALFRSIVQPGDVVCDVGANIGAFTVPLAQMVGERGGVFAFEPQPFIYYCLSANVALNSCPNVICERSVVGAQRGTTTIRQLDYREPGNFGGFECDRPQGVIPTNIVTLDAFRLGRCDFIKVDVEGMERDVLLGATRTIAKHRPVLYVESDRPGKVLALCELLARLGYEWRTHQPPLYNPENFAGNPVNVFPNLISQNLICAPKR